MEHEKKLELAVQITCARLGRLPQGVSFDSDDLVKSILESLSIVGKVEDALADTPGVASL